MSTPQDLRQLEKKIFRATYEDGLLDIYMGLLVAGFGSLAFMPDEGSPRLLYYGLFVGGLSFGILIYQLGKKYVTEPRMGLVTYGAERKRRAATLAVILSVIIGLQALIVGISILLWNVPDLARNLGLAAIQPDREKLLVSVISALFVGPGMALMAYFTDFQRGYFIAVLLTLAVFLMVWFSSPAPMLTAGGIMIIVGAVLLVRFLRKYPLPSNEEPHA